MNLNLLDNFKKNLESNDFINNFIEELSNFLKNTKENINELSVDNSINPNRKEGHLYLVTEDRNNTIYLWDFTDKPKTEFKETILSKDLLSVAKEGAMLQYKDGQYSLYSPNGYDMLFTGKDK